MNHRCRTPALVPGFRLGRILAGIAGLIGTVLLAAESPGPGQPGLAAPPGRLHILTTLAPLYSWAAQVAGREAEVENLLPADVGPHDFQFSPSTLQKLQRADVIIANGLGLEDWLGPAIVHNTRVAARPVVLVTDGLEASFIRHLPRLDLAAAAATPPEKPATGGGLEPPNPHLWLDPVAARHGITNILRALQQRDPTRAAAYARNAAAYLAELETLDADFRAAAARFAHRSIVTFHDAFPYLARRYGLELVGVVEEVPAVAPSPRYLSALSRVIRQRGVQVIFTEPQFEPRLVRQLSHDLGIRFAELDVLETGRPAPDFYVTGMRRNLRVLEAALR